MKMRLKIKGLVLVLCLCACGFSAVAQEKISFAWEGFYWNVFGITATNGKQFTVDWGDGSNIETITGTGNWQGIAHDYADSNHYMVIITGFTSDCLFTNLTVNDRGLTDLDINECTALEELYCSDNKLTILDLRANTALQYLNCMGNRLTNLALKENTALLYLNCLNNDLADLAINANMTLQFLDCSHNRLPDLDVSEHIALQSLICSYNQLVSLNVSGCMALQYLGCDNNRITGLDVSGCTALSSLGCSHNQLTGLDLNKNTALSGLSCSHNQLASLDLSTNTALYSVFCSSNQLTYLDISKNMALERLHCSNNQLTNLGVDAAFGGFWELECYDNRLHLSELHKIAKMGYFGSATLLLGTQKLVPQTVKVGQLVDFSAQKEFDGIATVFAIEKEGLPAPASDYAINDGIITFYQRGNYTVTMTNDTIISHKNFPAEVIAEFNVGNVSIADAVQEIAEVKIYPNPTTGKITIRNQESGMSSEIEVFDVVGRKLLSHTPLTSHSSPLIEIDISHLSAGLYFLKIDGKTVKVVKQ